MAHNYLEYLYAVYTFILCMNFSFNLSTYFINKMGNYTSKNGLKSILAI